MEIWKQNFSVAKAGECEALAELTRYRLICDWACQRIEKLETQAQTQQREKRILLDTLFEVQAENIMQGEDILRQRDELIKLRGEPEERVSCQR